MKQNKRNVYAKTNIKLATMVIPIVVIMMLVSFELIRAQVTTLLKEKLALESRSYADDISEWTDQILSELNIYKSVVEYMGLEDDDVYKMLKSSSGTHEEYPYGIYMGDKDENYFDSSDWVPGEDYVVTEREWYIEGLEHENFAFGEPYIDAMTGSTCVSVTTKVGIPEKQCVMSVDVYLDYAAQLVTEITKGNVNHAFYVTGETRVILADSIPEMIGKQLKDIDSHEIYQKVNELLDEGKTGQSEIEIEGALYIIDINNIDNTNWYFVTSMNEKDALKSTRHMELLMTLIAFIATMVLILITIRIARDFGAIKIKAVTDILTGILNRDGFRNIIMKELVTQPDKGALVICDLDNFKLINDQLGHPEGDLVLKRFAKLLEQYFDETENVVSRIGGDEFAVFMRNASDNKETREKLEKFVALVYNTFAKDYPEQKISVSMGVAYVTEDKVYESLYRDADKALYEVKQNGKNGLRVE